MKRILYYLCFCIFFLSCDSDNDTPILEEPSNFYALTVGNSWTYKNFKLNLATGVYEDTGVVDHISIIDIEEIQGNTYYKMRRLTTGNENNITFCNPNGEYFELVRDSLGYLINDLGKIKFTNSDFSERLLSENDWGNLYERLTVGNTDINVEAGSFTCINSERFGRNAEGIDFPGLDKFYYADGIGLIYDTSSYVNVPTHSIERHLISYTIK